MLLFKIINTFTDESLIGIEDVLNIKGLIKLEKFGVLKTSGTECNLLDVIKEDVFEKYNSEEILELSDKDDIKSLTISDFIDFWFYTEKRIDFSKHEIGSNFYITSMKSWSPQPYEGLTVDISYEDFVILEIRDGVVKLKRENNETEEIIFGILL